MIAALALGLALWPEALSLEPATARAAALVLLALGFWATGVLPFHVTGIGLFVLATLFGIAPPRVIFAGFASSRMRKKGLAG